jgi:hypothetical protein
MEVICAGWANDYGVSGHKHLQVSISIVADGGRRQEVFGARDDLLDDVEAVAQVGRLGVGAAEHGGFGGRRLKGALLDVKVKARHVEGVDDTDMIGPEVLLVGPRVIVLEL